MYQRLFSILFFLLLLHPITGFSQGEEDRRAYDSLYNIINSEAHDTTILSAYIELGNVYYRLIPDSSVNPVALKHAQSALQKDYSKPVQKQLQRQLFRIRFNIALDDFGKGRFEEAISSFMLSQKDAVSINDLASVAESVSMIAQCHYRLNRYDSAEIGYKHAIQIQRELGDKKELAASLSFYANMLKTQGKIEKAIAIYNESIELCKEIKDDRGLMYQNIFLGEVYYHKGNSFKALDLWYSAKAIADTIPHRGGMARAINNIGAVYYSLENWEKSIEAFNEALEINLLMKSDYNIYNGYSNLASAYAHMKNFKKSLELYKKAYEGFEKMGIKPTMASTLVNLGATYGDIDSLDIGLEYCKRGQQIAIEIKNKSLISHSYFHLANIYFKQKKFDLAEKFNKKSMALAKELNYSGRIEKSAELFAKIYKVKRNWKGAFENYELFTSLKDSLKGIKLERKAIQQEAAYKIEKAKLGEQLKEKELLLKEEKITALNQDKLLGQIILFATIGGVIALFVIAFLWFNGYKQKVKANELEAEQELKSLFQQINLLESNLVERNEINSETLNENLSNIMKTSLTKRETEVLIELCKGKENKEIAETLSVSVNTVRAHLLKIYNKLDVKNRAQAIKKAESLNRMQA